MTAKRKSFEKIVFNLVLLAALPSFLVAIVALWFVGFSAAAIALVSILLLAKIFFIAHFLRQRLSFQLRTLSNLLEAVINGDYSIRGRHDHSHQSNVQRSQLDTDAYTELVVQINRLADSFVEQRLEVKESQLLLAKVINNIDIAIFTCDDRLRVSLANPAFCQLLGKSSDSIVGATISDLGINGLIHSEPNQPVEWSFSEHKGRYSVHRDTFIEDGTSHHLILIKDVRTLLRSEEKLAWQKLIRVIGHEINNSLSPIASLSGSLQKLVGVADKQEVLRQSLVVINERAAGLTKLVSGYKTLAREPNPVLQRLDLRDVINHVATLFPSFNIEISVKDSPHFVLADQSQIEQVVINLVRNAHESNAVALQRDSDCDKRLIVIDLVLMVGQVALVVQDQGAGISNPDNIFVPFYTTKPEGSGIGLAVSRQIMEAHGGELTLANRSDGQGCIARVVFPYID